jgi:hypothetical protein
MTKVPVLILHKNSKLSAGHIWVSPDCRANPKSGSAIEIQNGFLFGTGFFYCWFQIDGVVAISVHCTRPI